MLNATTAIFVLVIVTSVGITLATTNSLLNFLLLAEYTNFLIFPAVTILASTYNNPYNLLIVIPAALFSASETILCGSVIFYNNKN